MYKTYWKICNRYFWSKMQADVTNYVEKCSICAQNKVEQKLPAGLMGNKPTAKVPWQLISLDFISPFPRYSQGCINVLVVTDHYSKFVVLFPVQNISAKTLVEWVEERIFLMYEALKFIICNNMTSMKSKEICKLCENDRVFVSFIPLYYPRADPTERLNRVVKTMIAHTI